jgi:hypothetical protein
MLNFFFIAFEDEVEEDEEVPFDLDNFHKGYQKMKGHTRKDT